MGFTCPSASLLRRRRADPHVSWRVEVTIVLGEPLIALKIAEMLTYNISLGAFQSFTCAFS